MSNEQEEKIGSVGMYNMEHFHKAYDELEQATADRIAKFDFSKVKVQFNVPVSWDQWFNMNVAHFIIEQARKPFFYGFEPLASRSPELGRNGLISKQLDDPGWTHMMFCDWDTYPLPAMTKTAMERLISMDKDVAAGMYPVWLHNLPFWTVVTKDDADKERLAHPTLVPFPFVDHRPVERVGMGFTLIKRKVLEGMESPWMKQLYKPDMSIRCTEDYYFCDKAKTAGFEIWLDPMMVCGHSQRRDTLIDTMVTAKFVSEMKDEQYANNGRLMQMKRLGVEGEVQDTAA